mmetsp:Transcript_54903/g.81700  ORF Transcript_54903/g.81700 Transcript_54903/m.81700 type:complete len:287 (+) Transcript_54903:621-1481(+)
MLVSMVQYILSHTTPDEVAAYYLQGPCSVDFLSGAVVVSEGGEVESSKTLSLQAPKKKQKTGDGKSNYDLTIERLAIRYQEAKSKMKKNSATNEGEGKSNEEMQNVLSSLSSRLLGLAAVIFMERIVSYSGCNESLLRGALYHGLTSKDEVHFAFQILAKLLKKTCSGTVVRWISALADAHIGVLINDDTEEEEHDIDPIKRLHSALSAALGQTHNFIQIKELLEYCSPFAYEQSKAGDTAGKPRSKDERVVVFDSEGIEKVSDVRVRDVVAKAPISDYSIELLQF